MANELPKEHTVVLIQPTGDKTTRTYFDFENLAGALTGICSVFENTLRDLNPGLAELTYDVSDLLRYIDGLPDISLMVRNGAVYVPQGKVFITNRLYSHMQRIYQKPPRR